MIRRLVLALLVTSAATHGHSDHPLGQAWRWSHFTVEDGLPSSSVLRVLEVADGTIWAATGSGLTWFDGFQWHPATDLPGAPPDLIAGALQTQGHGNLVTTIDGKAYVGHLDGFQTIALDQDFEFAAATDVAGEYFFLTRDSGLYRWRDGNVSPLPPPAGVSVQDILNVRRSDDGTLWLRAPLALYRYDADGQWIQEQQGLDLAHAVITPDGRRYAAVELPFEKRGIWTWRSGQAAEQLPQAQSDLARDIAVSPTGQILVIFESGTALVIDGEQATELRPGPPELRDAQDAAYGSNGDLWIAGGGGISVHRSVVVPWQRWVTADAGARNRVDEILIASDGAVWVGTDGGVEVRHPDGRVDWIDQVAGQDLRIVTGLGEDDEGGIWVSSGASWDGAFRYYQGQWRFYGAADGLRSSKIHRIERDRSGRLWFLGLQGAGVQRTQGAAIVTFSDNQFTEWSIPLPLGSARLYDIGEDSEAGLWFAGVRGIGRWHLDQWQLWDTSSGLKSDKVFSLAVSHAQRVFFSDQKNGLGRIEAGQIEYFDSEDGLVHNSIWDLDLDDEGTLWMATRGGLGGFREDLWLSFGGDSGLEALELWPVATDGDRVLIGSAGQGTFILDRTLRSHAPPRVIGVDTLVSQNDAVLRWQAFAHRGGDRATIQTRYRLDDMPWSDWSVLPEARLADVSSGRHQLSVQARDEYGHFDEGIQIPFVVQAPYYQRPAFFIPVGLSAITVLLLVLALVERRRQHAARLRESEDRFRSFFEEAPISLWEHDYADVQAFLESLGQPDAAALRQYLKDHPKQLFECLKRIRVLHVNRATLALFEAEDAQQLERQMYRIFRRNSFEAFCEGLVAVNQGDHHFSSQTSAHTLSGRPLEVIMSWAVAPGSTRDYSRVLVTVLDISAQHQAAEEMRLAAQAAQEASFAKSAFLANTSHEIRTPFNAIMGMAQALQEEGLSTAAQDQVDTILRASDTLTHIIDDLLDLSKIEAGELDLESVRFQLPQMVEDVRRTVTGTAAAKGLTLTTRIAEGSHADVVGDPTRLGQILLNLVSNAIKFTEAGEILVNISSRREGHRVIVQGEVVDHGIGIPADRLVDIFNPFTQADGSITRTHGGTGLGLSICRRLVEMMDGRIEADSVPGEGSRFHFTVHLQVARGQRAAAPDLDAVVGHADRVQPRRILVAEDNELNRKVVRALLRSDQHDLVEVENGRLAVAACQSSGPFDVVLMDVQMPEMDGLTATQQIRANEAATGQPRTPIVALTANTMESDRQRCLAAGMDDFISKPVRKQALRRILASVLSETGSWDEDGAVPVSPGSPSAAQILDPQPLEDLRELAQMDPDFSITGFIELFLTEAPQTLIDARAALTQQDHTTLHRAVHTLKGSAREVGAVELGERAMTLEQQLKVGDTGDAEQGLQELTQLLDSTCDALRDVAARETEKG